MASALSTSYLLVFVLSLAACRQNLNNAPSSNESGAVAQTISVLNRPDGWDAYWYSGLAELNTYDYTQNRYGQDRPGEAILIFVTEPFLVDAQVKDEGKIEAAKSISILKLNRIQRFNTGIYDYSVMLSSFTPVSRDQYPHTLKTTLSAQDWCGQSWFQLNLRKSMYEAERRSYFQAEADAKTSLPAVLLEDELPALIRLDPQLLPMGKTRMIPGAMFSALFHVMPEQQEVEITQGTPEPGVRTISLDYPGLDRQLVYRFGESFPHKLLGWTERYKGTVLSTATLKESRQEPYWSQNKLNNNNLREQLGL